jgi:alpha-amylase/alpha-mannosidase (GH57 family)
MTIHVAFLFHIYQPPTQIPLVIRQIVNESYRPILETLRTCPLAKITLNINATLTEQLNEYGFNDVINSIGALANKGQIEYTGSGKFHPLLPLLPEPEVIRQIKLNNETNKKFFGNYNPRGFFPPEMAVSEEIYEPIRKMGFDWIIMSGIANTLSTFPTNFISTHSETSLKLIFRDDIISNDVGFDKINTVDNFTRRLSYRNTDTDYYVILAMDGETFGHHVKHGIRNFLKPFFQSLEYRNDIQLCTISEIIDKYPKENPQVPKDSSWSTMDIDIILFHCG